MEFVTGYTQHEADIPQLFRDVFSASEGAAEGALIGTLAQVMMATAPKNDLYVFSARDGDVMTGCIFFSRVDFAEDDRRAFILSPVAVRTDRQRTGVGQTLIRFGLQRLRKDGVDYALTYGDPEYYCKTGFQLISEAFARAPLPLSHPHGWLGQSLSERGTAPYRGASRCVDALNQPELW
ncbi:Predicted N-acetyltransferase YhbS [Ruegeria halocynthiae]|uniref:Predicted N-acetyltransferase YhbS n=1 Tax=Ruegeria halocynthiae TaxID=985054 RepID=A0A1H2STC1_9RHOB|nr:N-acetyltransferase [Ruegeria halocynthiae]SDW34923.1 Predicted N-acetyltransferase YhbS [Ruegeria halocynthiae]